MSNPIRPKDIVGAFTWQKLQHENTWLDGDNQVHTLWRLRRAVKKLPLVGRLAQPRADQRLIKKIRQHLLVRNISEADIKLLLMTSNIIKLGCNNYGELTEKAYKAIDRETLDTLVANAEKSRGELLATAASKSRGAVSREIRKQQNDIGAIGATLPVMPAPQQSKLLLRGTKFRQERRRRIPITRAAAMAEKALANRKVEPENPSVPVPGSETSPAAPQLSTGSPPPGSPELNRATKIPFTSIPHTYRELCSSLIHMGALTSHSQSLFSKLYQGIRPGLLLHPAFPSQLLAFNKLLESGSYSWNQFIAMVNQDLLSKTSVNLILQPDFNEARQKVMHKNLRDGLTRYSARSSERKKHHQALSKVVEPQRLLIQHSPGDGNCFYHSVAAHTGENQAQVRERLHQTGMYLIKEKPQLINVQHGWPGADELRSNLEQGYIQNSAQGVQPDRYWGSSELIPLVCLAYQRPAVFYSAFDANPICYTERGIPCALEDINHLNPIRLANHASHWDAVVPEIQEPAPPLPQVESSQQLRMENLIKANQNLPDSRDEAASIPLPKTFLHGADESALVTPTELKELTNLQQGVEILRRNAEQTNANCQGFINSVEYFARGRGYNQVHGTDNDLKVSNREGDYGNQSISPVAGWTAKTLLETGREFWKESDFFEQMQPGRQVVAGKRFLMLKVSSMKNLDGNFDSAAGHYANLVTLNSGRLAVIDGQSNMLFPVFNADGTPTPRAKEYFKSCRIQLVPIDTQDDHIFTRSLEASNQYLTTARHSEVLVKEARDLKLRIISQQRQRYQHLYKKVPQREELNIFIERQPVAQSIRQMQVLQEDLTRFLENPKESQTVLKNLNLALAEALNNTRQMLHA